MFLASVNSTLAQDAGAISMQSPTGDVRRYDIERTAQGRGRLHEAKERQSEAPQDTIHHSRGHLSSSVTDKMEVAVNGHRPSRAVAVVHGEAHQEIHLSNPITVRHGQAKGGFQAASSTAHPLARILPNPNVPLDVVSSRGMPYTVQPLPSEKRRVTSSVAKSVSPKRRIPSSSSSWRSNVYQNSLPGLHGVESYRTSSSNLTVSKKLMRRILPRPLSGVVGGIQGTLPPLVPTTLPGKSAKPAHVVRKASMGQASTWSVSSWMLFHISRQHASEFKGPLSRGTLVARNALADALGLCRPAIRVTDARAFDIGSFERVLVQVNHNSHELQRGPSHYSDIFSVVEVRLAVEIPVFSALNLNTTDLEARVNHLQIFSSFADLDLLLSYALREIGIGEDSGLDDVGRARVHQVEPNDIAGIVTDDEVADCLAEDELRSARSHHHLVMVLSFILVGLITCTGIALFTVQRAVVIRGRVHSFPNSLSLGF